MQLPRNNGRASRLPGRELRKIQKKRKEIKMNLKEAVNKLSEMQPDSADMLEETLEELEQLNGIVDMLMGRPETITIPVTEYRDLIRENERYKLIETYILNNEYYGVEALRVMTGYTGEE